MAGLLGVGGGLIMVPSMLFVLVHFGVAPVLAIHIAVGTSLAAIVANSSFSLFSHMRHRAADNSLVNTWAPFMALGGAAGAWFADMLGGIFLTILFTLVTTAIALSMAFDFPRRPSRRRINPKKPSICMVAGGIGALSSMVGIGGGALSVPLLMFLGKPMRMAVGTSSGFGFFLALPAAVGFILAGWNTSDLPPYSLGYVNGLGLACLVTGSMITVPLGARYTHKFNRTTLRRIFSGFLIVMALRMTASII